MPIVLTPQLVIDSDLPFFEVSGNGGSVRFSLPVEFNPSDLSSETIDAINELFTVSSARRQGVFDARDDGGEFVVIEQAQAIIPESVDFPRESFIETLRLIRSEASIITKYLDNDNTDLGVPGPSWAREHLISARVPREWTVLPHGLFFGCANLKAISLPPRLTVIANSAVAFCFNLESLTIPDSVLSFRAGALTGCPKLTIFCSDVVYQRMSSMEEEPLVLAEETRICVRGPDGRRRLMLNARGQVDARLPSQLRALISVTSNDQLVLLIIACMRGNFARLTPGQCMAKVLTEYPDVTLDNIRVVLGEAPASRARRAVLSKADLSFLNPSSLFDLLPSLFQCLSFSDLQSFVVALLAAAPREEAGSKRKFEALPEPKLGPLLGILFCSPDDEERSDRPEKTPRAAQMAIEAAKPLSP